MLAGVHLTEKHILEACAEIKQHTTYGTELLIQSLFTLEEYTRHMEMCGAECVSV